MHFLGNDNFVKQVIVHLLRKTADKSQSYGVLVINVYLLIPLVFRRQHNWVGIFVHGAKTSVQMLPETHTSNHSYHVSVPLKGWLFLKFSQLYQSQTLYYSKFTQRCQRRVLRKFLFVEIYVYIYIFSVIISQSLIETGALI